MSIFRKIKNIYKLKIINRINQIDHAKSEKLSKLLYEPLKVDFRSNVTVNLPCLHVYSKSRKDNLFSFSVSRKNDMLIWREFRKSWKYFKWLFRNYKNTIHITSLKNLLKSLGIIVWPDFSWYDRNEFYSFLFNSFLQLPATSQTHRHYRVITAEISLLGIASSRTWTRTWIFGFWAQVINHEATHRLLLLCTPVVIFLVILLDF